MRKSRAALPVSRLDERQRELLQRIRVTDNLAVYDSPERIPDWAKLKTVMEKLGARWKARKGFLFPDDADGAELVRLALAHGEVLDPQAAGFYPTPTALAERVVELAQLFPGARVLEPSAGTGSLAKVAFGGTSVELHCVELLPSNVKHLRGGERYLGWNVVEGDFLTMTPESLGSFDRIIMNPPFAGRADILHVQHALLFLRPGGRLVAIMSAGVEFRQDRLATEFRERVLKSGGIIERNPDGSFAESGTQVRTVTVVLDAAEQRTRPAPVERAMRRGHQLENDPPANELSRMNRMTCTVCGRAVLWRGDSHAYGSALEEDCAAPKQTGLGPLFDNVSSS